MKLDAAHGQEVQKLRRRIAANIAPYPTMLLAFSGGLDSTVLLDALTLLRDENEALLDHSGSPEFRAVHVHHGLNRYADRWVTHCAHECRLRDVDFSTVRIVIDATPDGIEATARHARYKALASKLSHDDEVLLTAQHQNDQAETLLLALKRGSGPAGLAGMTADIPFGGHRLVRPLLGCSRSELEAYAYMRQLSWIDDASNNDLRFDRNFLRLEILPSIQQRWPQFVAAAARSAQLCAEQEWLLDELLAETLIELTQQDGSLHLTALMPMSDIKRAALLRRWLTTHGVRMMPSRQQLNCLWREVACSRRDAVAQIQLNGQQVRRFRDRLYVLPCVPTLSDRQMLLPWPRWEELLRLPARLGTLFRRQGRLDTLVLHGGGKPLIVPSHGNNIGQGMIAAPVAVVRAPLPEERVSVRFGCVRGLLYITGRRRGRKLKKIWQELGIPPWRRACTPLLFYNDRLIAALGVFVTCEGAMEKPEEELWQLFLRPDSKQL